MRGDRRRDNTIGEARQCVFGTDATVNALERPVVGHAPASGLQDRGDADLGTEMLGIDQERVDLGLG